MALARRWRSKTCHEPRVDQSTKDPALVRRARLAAGRYHSPNDPSRGTRGRDRMALSELHHRLHLRPCRSAADPATGPPARGGWPRSAFPWSWSARRFSHRSPACWPRAIGCAGCWRSAAYLQCLHALSALSLRMLQPAYAFTNDRQKTSRGSHEGEVCAQYIAVRTGCWAINRRRSNAALRGRAN
jgi:hypothetical protein